MIGYSTGDSDAEFSYHFAAKFNTFDQDLYSLLFKSLFLNRHFINCKSQGRIHDFKLGGGGGGALKKIAWSGGRRENCWGISCENFRGGAPPPPPLDSPLNHVVNGNKPLRITPRPKMKLLKVNEGMQSVLEI